jgi:two-component system chemotaxis sensor kinase CheA
VKAGRAQRIASEKIQKNETVDLIDFEGALIPLIRLDKLLDSNPHTAEDRDFPLIIILHDQEKKIALQVEEIQEENEMIIKPFNRQIEKIKYVSGASISAGGEIIPILDVKEIIQSAAQKSIPTLPEKSIIKKSLSILLVDDSVTSLMVMRDLLETAGHRVTSAHDGIEAHEKIANFNFDLVVSDVEMPRMNGFELTKKIKSEPAFRHIPVILVTGLSKPQYKTMGMNAGAQAFILKSTFNDQILLETINQLMDKQ